ncbi:MAG: Dabb family protein [Actinomycetota bacterium]|nr:Dabb family protein [Actinomycetota bacterium]
MYSVTRLLDVVEHDRDRVLSAVRAGAANTGAQCQLIEPTLPGTRNGGDVLVHLRFGAEGQWHSAESDFAALFEDPAITAINGACYSGAASCSGATGTVYRALLLCVRPGTAADTIARFEDELRLMPRYVKTITAWQLSRVEQAIGIQEWTHVFEQEFTDVEGLMGPYLMHPIHWAVVDRWFDPECPEVIVRNPVCHSFCAITDPVLS